MRIEDALARLRTLPDRLPSSPPELMPVLTDDRPQPRFTRLRDEDRPAGVLVLIVPDRAGSARVVLTERPTYDGLHSGEVSFPGGKV